MFCSLFFCLILRPPPISTLFPYTTLFRSCLEALASGHAVVNALREKGYSIDRTQRIVELVRAGDTRSEEHTSELQSRGHLVCRLLLEKKKKNAVANS